MLEILPKDLFLSNTNLNTLHLGNNKLVTLPEGLFSSNTKLEKLYIHSNNLVSLPKDLFSSNSNLNTLYLRDNKLVTLPEGLFSNNTKLKTLSLEDNKLVTLPEGLFSNNTNREYLRLYMKGNQFICCLMNDFKEWASNQTKLDYEGTCTGLNTTIDIHNFNMTDCIIPGWSLWFNSSCSVTCGDGVIMKTRTCDNPPPSDDGLKCVGSRTETSLCNLGKCRESCRHSKKGSNNKSVDNLDNKSGKKLRNMKP
ncbi:carboxypeptidase N subunit 2-like [Mytilus californianus]|uniref:carboxypeptidase N subunit 2-like n=1 Tax=Mytilus californianus TaxID=6549 RepID=UPI0022468227|nr:carboxypeptidase N subunit 2-like [Mytilus californianus]